GRKLSEMKVVFNGAGAAGISCARMFIAAGGRRENIIMCDSKGVIHSGRVGNLTVEKLEFVVETDARTLEDAVKGADVFIGLSVADCLSPDMLKSMAPDPVVFAMSNPNPEIQYPLAIATRSDVIMATGRSDYPNQINNVLGFPFIFRGALDVQATSITEGMKMAASRALAALAKEPVPELVKKAYGGTDFSFGPNYIVPKPFDPRVIEYEAVAVARAACEEGVARKPIIDWDKYRKELADRMKKYWE
ncbi:MAG: malic enzyme-like NAD(P)-binding protein, partial [Spirochaetota bacterium]|nr:malic enzyme-like NAD(P)-binding protein [Spirochaetota bacterium]